MKRCSLCKKMTDSEPLDRSKPIICYDCRYSCKTCGARVYGGGHIEYCNSCAAKMKSKTEVASGFRIIDKTTYGGTKASETHYKDIHTRTIDDNGNSISGKAGLDYMKTNPTRYASQLKEYYK